MESKRHVSSSSSTRKRKHHEDVQVDPRYRGLVEYSSGAVNAGPSMNHNHTNHNGAPVPSNSRMKRHFSDSRHDGAREKRVRIVEEPTEIDGDGNISDTGAELGESVVDSESDELSEKFNKFNSALAGLLSLVDGRPEVSHPLLDRVIGRERGTFVKAMKAMQVEGSLPWLATSARPAATRQFSNFRRQPSAEPSNIISMPKRSLREGSIDRHAREASIQRDRVSPVDPPSRKISGSSHRTASGSSSVPPAAAVVEPSQYAPYVPSLATGSYTIDNSAIRLATASKSKPWPPPLPRIHNPKIERQVFTHKSYVDADTDNFDQGQLHNERLEWIGDSCLGAVATRYIYATFTNLREGHLSMIRQKFVENAALNEYAKMYGFDTRLKVGKDQLEKIVGAKKTLADTFEAYIGGLLLDSPQGGEIVDKWLVELFAPKLLQFVEEYKSKTPVNKTAKNHLQGIIGGKHCEFEYKWVGGGGGNAGGFDIEAYFTGWGFNRIFLGKAWGNNKGEAQLRAAMDALENGPVEKIRLAKERWYRENPPPQLDVASDNGTIRRMVVS